MIVDELRLAQDLMLILNTDVSVKFVVPPGEKKIDVLLETETALANSVQQEIKRKKMGLKTIRGVFFKDALGGSYTKDEVTLKFLSRGAVMSKGVMRLSSTDEQNPPSNALQSYICLSGYPRPIFSKDSQEAAEKECNDAQDDAYYQQLTRETFAMLPEKLNKKTEDKPQEPQKPTGEENKPKPEEPNRPSPPKPSKPTRD